MSEKTKPNKKDKKTLKKNRVEIKPENHSDANEENLDGSRKKESYYYDDSYGYEIYNPDEADNED